MQSLLIIYRKKVIWFFYIFLDKYLSTIISSFNPIILNYDYIKEQLYFKLSDEFIQNSDTETIKLFSSFKEWKEYKSLDILQLEVLNILNTIEEDTRYAKNFNLDFNFSQDMIINIYN